MAGSRINRGNVFGGCSSDWFDSDCGYHTHNSSNWNSSSVSTVQTLLYHKSNSLLCCFGYALS